MYFEKNLKIMKRLTSCRKSNKFLCCLQLSFKTALLLERYEKRGLAGGDIQLGEEALKRRPTFGKTEDAAFRQVFSH
jgi:hypothetical protein